MKKTTGLFHDELCLWHSTQGLFSLVLPVGSWVQPPPSAGLAESPESKRRAISLMEVSGLSQQISIQSAPSANEANLTTVHPTQYLKRFEELSVSGGGEIGAFAPFGPGSYEIAKKSAGLAIEAVDSVLSGRFKNAYSMSRPPGHHCGRETPMGFCLLANIAIAVEVAQQKHGLNKIAVIDWDVHHGNGTQEIFYNRSDVLTISIHQDGCFPPGYSGLDDSGEDDGKGFNINIPLMPGGGDHAYTHAMRKIVLPAIDRYQPELIVVASGYDAGGFDPLGRMLLHSESYRSMTDMMKAAASEHCGGKLVVVHEGGYSEAHVPFCVHAVIESLSEQRTEVVDPSLEMMESWQPNNRFNDLQVDLIEEIATKHHL